MANWDEIKQEWETTKITLADLAEKHGIKLGTLKSRKSREKWSRDATEKDATKIKKVATKEKQVGAPKGNTYAVGNKGNPNPPNQFTKRNTAAVTHGFFQKFLPEETLEIMEAMNERSPADLIWDQIQIQYAAIIRAQRIMHVESKDEMIKELKKHKDTEWGEEVEYEFQFAWERQAQLLTAQSRAIGELRSSIRQFVEMADQDDERRLKLEQMQLNINKTKVEISKLENPDSHKQESEIAKMLRRMAGGE
ncbi:phage terminase small subunit [Lysinibacillus capsici]|uniref:phage terminase small subunit n=1 Tax=Lysinibacillus capsici TaxID=2115968 RepID=UPI00247FED2A|nr:phage terminase small subunit [Lysinibacillus capsici]